MASPQQGSVYLPSLNIERLRGFHQTHFAVWDIPRVPSTEDMKTEGHDDDGLGWYADGAKRTLTDEQVKMFRHSEIQRLLSERKQGQTRRKEDQRRQRRQEKRASRPHRFDDEPALCQQDVDNLKYDDEPTAMQEQQTPGEKKFLWPVLGL